MKTESIEIKLNHYRDKDYECKDSKLTMEITINDGTKEIELTGIRAESLFRMIIQLAEGAEMEEKDSTNCCICGEPIVGYGHNPNPVKKNGRCCNDCNATVVIPARLEEYK